MNVMQNLQMANTGFDHTPASEKLSLISYNCQYADNVRLPFIKHLFSQCDFLFIQEHGRFKSTLSWFHTLGKDVGVHGVSAMDEGQILRGPSASRGVFFYYGGKKHNFLFFCVK